MVGERWGVRRIPGKRNHVCKDPEAGEIVRKLGAWGQVMEVLLLSRVHVVLPMCPTALCYPLRLTVLENVDLEKC